MQNHCCYRPMTLFNLRPVIVLLTILAALAWAVPALAAIQPYSARYSIYRNGSLTGKVEVIMVQEGELWIIKSKGSGTHGLARILRASDTEQVIGRLREGRFWPDQYSRHTRVAGIDDEWLASFDWESRRVIVVHDGDETFDLEMTEDALDPLSLKMEMRQRLGEPHPDLGFQMVEEDEIDEQNFRVLPTEWLETSLGCLETTPVEKIRHNSKRYTRAWHAPELDNIEVRMEHGKTGGNHLEMRITELVLDGRSVSPRPGCSARQTGADETDDQQPEDTQHPLIP